MPGPENAKLIEEQIHFYTLNVGQGDSHVIYFQKNESAVIIDPANGELINQLLHHELKIKQIPLILISHGDMDHMAGLNEVIGECIENRQNNPIKPGCIFFNHEGMLKGYDKPERSEIKKFYKKFKYLAQKNKLKLKGIVSDDNSSDYMGEIFQQYGIECKILYPNQLDMIDVHLDQNYNLGSVLLYIIFANKKILYTGDLPYEGWQSIAQSADLKSDVFKVPHHGGSITKTPGPDTRKILERVNPNFALISVGSNNGFKHPIPEVVDAIVTHQTKPHLFCTQMTDRCCPDNNIKEKIHRFYEEQLGNREEKRIFKLGSQQGTLCAGTIRVTFDKNRAAPYTFPPVSTHYNMLKTLLKPQQILCRGRF